MACSSDILHILLLVASVQLSHCALQLLDALHSLTLKAKNLAQLPGTSSWWIPSVWVENDEMPGND